MNRRDFLGVIVGGVAISTAVRTWPFRVYSFPSDVKSVNLGPMRRFYDTDVRRMKISPDQKAWLEDLRRIAWETRCRAVEPAGVRRSLDRAWQQFAFYTGSNEIIGGATQNEVPWPLA